MISWRAQLSENVMVGRDTLAGRFQCNVSQIWSQPAPDVQLIATALAALPLPAGWSPSSQSTQGRSPAATPSLPPSCRTAMRAVTRTYLLPPQLH